MVAQNPDDARIAWLYLQPMTSDAPKEINPILKLLLEVGPLGVFFFGFNYGEDIAKSPSIAPLLESVLSTDAMASDQGPILVATALFMAAGAVFFTADAIAGPARYPVRFSKMFFLGWNAVVLTSMHFVWQLGVFQLS